MVHAVRHLPRHAALWPQPYALPAQARPEGRRCLAFRRERQDYGYGFPADWWGVGIFAFECFTTTTPFAADDPMAIYKKILRAAVAWPSRLQPASARFARRHRFGRKNHIHSERLSRHIPSKPHLVLWLLDDHATPTGAGDGKGGWT